MFGGLKILSMRNVNLHCAIALTLSTNLLLSVTMSLRVSLSVWDVCLYAAPCVKPLHVFLSLSVSVFP